MDLSPLGVRATSGTLRLSSGTVLQHAWTEDGVVAGPATNGGQLLHLSVAFCILNDIYREARKLGIEVRGVEVSADGEFDEQWRSTGIVYAVTVDSTSSSEELTALLSVVDHVAEIPRAIRGGAPVRRR